MVFWVLFTITNRLVLNISQGYIPDRLTIITEAGVEIAAGCRLKPIQFITKPAVLILEYEKKADSILH